MSQLDLHKKIEDFFALGPKVADIQFLQKILLNDDAKRYFFSKADENWLDWIWKNNLLDTIKNKAEDITKYYYRMPELEYLARMAEKKPVEVAHIINSIEISEVNFNPEVVDRFIWIINAFPAAQVKVLAPKINKERWIYLMRNFRKSVFEFKGMVEKLSQAKEHAALLELAQAILSIKTKDEDREKKYGFSMNAPFYIGDLDESGVFEAIAEVDDTHSEKALKITTEVITGIVKLGEKSEEGPFEYIDLFALYDVDFFTLEIENNRRISDRDDVKNLAATIKKLIEKTITKNCDNPDEVRRFFEYIDKIPLCNAIWRLRLFALAQCPDIFREELKDAFFKVFEVGERYFTVEGGAEYHQALKRCFNVFDNKTQREYVEKVFGYFAETLDDKDVEKWRKRDGIQVLSVIKEYLTLEEKEIIKEKFGVSIDDTNYAPEPTISEVKGGMVHHRSPANVTELTIPQIIENLKSEWTVEKIKEEDDGGDFLNPRSVEGLGNALKEDIKKRMNLYLENIKDFFSRDSIHPHYLYSLLYGIEEILRASQSLTVIQIKQLFDLFLLIRDEGIKTPFKRKDDKSWLVDWVGVHKVITDILILIIQNKELKESVHSSNREEIKNIIAYLMTIKDSPSKEQEKPEGSDLYHVVINSVRGRAFETFVVFTENDGKTLAQDVKELYREFLKDDSLAVRFAIGRYLASLYFRDKEFITSLFPQIFPLDDVPKKDIYLATWEGYLSNTLYDKLFIALKKYYEHAINFNPQEYTNRKYLKGLDESLAVHVALAFIHLGLEQKDDLFKLFWDTTNITRHKEFVSFIGRHVLTRDFVDDKWFVDNKVTKEKLVDFWQWLLNNPEIKDPEIFSEFGYWINSNKEVINDMIVAEKMVETLQKSGGDVDWDYGFLNRLEFFAEKSPDNTIKIITNYLLDTEGNLNPNHPNRFIRSKEIRNALKIIYRGGNAEQKQQIVDLINKLIEKGSSAFWDLKEVLNEDKIN